METCHEFLLTESYSLDVTVLLGNSINVRPLKQMPTREFSFVKLNWTSVIRFHLSCGTHSSIYSGSIHLEGLVNRY